MLRRVRTGFVCTALLVIAPVQISASEDPLQRVFEVLPMVETVAVVDSGDAADDAEVWRNAADPSQSRIFATDKKTGLFVLDLKGQQVAYFRVGRMNNVDLREGWDVSGHDHVLVAASDRSQVGITFFILDPATLTVSHLPKSFVAADVGDPYGMCLYRSRKNNALYAFVTGKTGEVRQFHLTPQRSGDVTAALVRNFAIGSIAEGCVADDRTGFLYIAEEAKGIWRYGAEPDDKPEREMIASVDGNQIVADIEGLTLAPTGENAGYLIASIQGNSTFALYSLPGETFAGRFRIVENTELGIDAVSGTDGIAAATGDFGPDFPAGILVVQDDENAGGTAQNFKIISWADVLAKRASK